MKKHILLLGILLIPIFFIGCLTTKQETTQPAESSIHELILQGRTSEAKNLFQSKVGINSTDENGNTPLHIAASVNDYDIVSFLVYMGADTEIKNNEGDTALHIAIKNNGAKSAEILSALNSNIFAKDGKGQTALALGIEKGPVFYDSLITTKTGDIKDSQGQTIVHYLVNWKKADALELAIKKGIPLSVADINGNTPLSLCYKNTNDLANMQIAASLLLANAAPVRGDFSYFEDAVKTRNPSLRFDDGQTPLHMATILGQKGIVQYLLGRGASTAVKDMSGATPLHEAVRYGRTDIAEILLNAGADVNAQDSLGKTPLLIVTPSDERTELYTILLKHGANPNAKDLYGDTPLHIATITGVNTSILEQLFFSGADINERNKKGVTPLALAVEHKRADHIDFYAKRGADIHAEDMDGLSPLIRALDTSVELTQKLITSANCSIRDSYGNTPLHLAIQRNASSGHIKYIIDCGADVNARNRNGDTPLFIAVQKNNRTIGELLISQKADVFATNTENYSPLRMALSAGGEVQDWILGSEVIKATDGIGNTPLHYAAEWKLDNSIAVLFEKGANPNIQNSNGESPIFSAVKADSPSTLLLLIKNGANKDIRDFLGNTPLHVCVRWDAKNAAAVLISGGADVNAQNLSGKTALHEAARGGKTAMVNLLLENKANINASDITGKTVLMDSIQSKNIDLVKLLLNKGASPLIQEMYGRNAYHEAVESLNIDLITLIRNAGGNPLSRDSYGNTPFSLVLGKGEAIIQAVLGNNIQISDSDGNTPIHIAVAHNVSSDTISMLLSMSYPVNRRNSLGITPLGLAITNKNVSIARVLLENGADPFTTDNSGSCPVATAILQNPDILATIVQTTGNKTDMAGDGVLHYAAQTADITTIQKLISMNLDKTARNISGETPYDVAVRWQRPAAILEALK